MINVNDFKTGVTISYDGNIYQVLEFQHVKPGKGAAIVKAKLKNLRTGSIAEQTFNAGIKIPTAHISKQQMQYLYASGSTYSFMNMETYEQIELEESQIKDQVKFLKEGLNVYITFFEGEMLGIDLPEKIDYKITSTEPAIKGNTATNATKDAIVETGLLVKVPLFIDEGEEIIVSTKDGKYVSRKQLGDFMIIDLTKLVIGNIDSVSIDDDVIIDNSYFADTSIHDLVGVRFYGDVRRIGDEYQLKGIVSGVMVLSDDITLEDVDYSFEVNIEEDFADGDENFKIVQNRLDITDFLWQNILVEVPSKIKKQGNEDLKLEGDGWRLVTEDELVSSNDSPFSELSKMFDSGKE